MSYFNLQLEYPEINYDWYQTNSDGDSICPANWTLFSDNSSNQYFDFANIGWIQIIGELTNDSVRIPFKSGYIDDLYLHRMSLRFLSDLDEGVQYDLNIKFNDSTTKTYTRVAGDWDTLLVEIPSYTEYIEISVDGDGASALIISVEDLSFTFVTNDFDINTEQNKFQINTNNRNSYTLDNTVIQTSLRERDVFYSNDLILKNAESIELDELLDVSLLNELLVSVNIDISDEAGSNLANIPSGSDENIVKYYYVSHYYGHKTGIYSYVTLNYKNDPYNNKTYI